MTVDRGLLERERYASFRTVTRPAHTAFTGMDKPGAFP
jgi:hypothetical protein